MTGKKSVKSEKDAKTCKPSMKDNPAAGKADAVKVGDTVRVEYEGRLDDGSVFDCTANHDGQLLEFEVGAGRMIKGFDSAMVGMKKGEEKTVKLAPEQTYGSVNQMLIQKIPREHLPKEPEPKAGMMLIASMPAGEQIPARIKEVTSKEVTLDFNHPLAGMTLTFKIKAVEIKAKNK